MFITAWLVALGNRAQRMLRERAGRKPRGSGCAMGLAIPALVDVLEARRMLSAFVSLSGDNDLTVTGDDAVENLTLSSNGTTLFITDTNGGLTTDIDGAVLSDDGTSMTVAYSLIPGDEILVDTDDGDDAVHLSGRYARSLAITADIGTDTVDITGPLTINVTGANGASLDILASGDVTVNGPVSTGGDVAIHGGNILLANNIRTGTAVGLFSPGTITQTAGQIRAFQVIVAADEGDIGSDARFLQTRTSYLTAFAANGGIFVKDVDGLIVGLNESLSDFMQAAVDNAGLEFNAEFGMGELPGLWTGEATSQIWVRSRNLLVEDNIEAQAGDILLRADGKAELDADILTGGGLWFRAVGGITQDEGGIQTASLAVASKNGSIVLDSADNNVDMLAASAGAKGKGVYLRDADDLAIVTLDGGGLFTTMIEGVVASGDVELLAGGSIFLDSRVKAGRFIRLQSETDDVTQSVNGAIKAKGLGVLAAGVIDLTATNNNVKLFAGQAGIGTPAFRDDNGFETGTVPAGLLIGEITGE